MFLQIIYTRISGPQGPWNSSPIGLEFKGDTHTQTHAQPRFIYTDYGIIFKKKIRVEWALFEKDIERINQRAWEKNHFIENVIMCFWMAILAWELSFWVLKKNWAITWIHGKLKGNSRLTKLKMNMNIIISSIENAKKEGEKISKKF